MSGVWVRRSCRAWARKERYPRDTLARDPSCEARTLAAARPLGEAVGWERGNATTRGGVATVHMEGLPPLPNTERLRNELEKRGVDPSEVHVEPVPARIVTFH